MQLFQKHKTFSEFFIPFLESTSNFQHFEKNIMVIANIFPKLQTVNNFDRPPCKKCRFGTRFDSHHVKESLILAKSPWEPFYHVFSSFWDNFIWKMSPLVLGKILGVFLHTLTADGKYAVEDWENLQLRMQMQLSKKRKTFSHFFVPFLNLHPILNIFRKNMMVIANVFPKLQTVKNFVRRLCKKRRFGTRFDSQHLKGSLIFAKCPWEPFYHVFESFWGKLIWNIVP